MTRPITISIHAIGGQGGGVLADWLAQVAGAAGWMAQSTSVPGVAQRTGATVYYLELAPRPPPGAPEPVLALMPMPGDVDLVIAAELMEAGRAINRGLVTPDRTVLAASSSRIYAIGEKTALGDGRFDPAPVLEAARAQSRRLLIADMEALAAEAGSASSACLFGAAAASGVLPFPRGAFEAVIRAFGVAVASNLAGFAAGYEAVGAASAPAPLVEMGSEAVLAEGCRRLADYQDAAYVDLYRSRLERFADLDATGLLTHELARHLALWMSYEDTVRVADLKVRSGRFERLRREAGAAPGQIVHAVDFLHPRVEEICETLPARLGAWLLRTGWTRDLLGRAFARGRFVRTTGLLGFLLLYAIAALRPWRRGTLRFREENARIEAWLDRVEQAARRDPALAVEIVRCQRLIKGYGDTYARGWRNFSALMARVEGADAAAVARWREAALADEDGCALADALAA